VLFLLYISDLEAGIKDKRPTILADDTSIFIAGNSANDVHRKINKTINALTEWLLIKKKQ
jgi:hypothetical protein